MQKILLFASDVLQVLLTLNNEESLSSFFSFSHIRQTVIKKRVNNVSRWFLYYIHTDLYSTLIKKNIFGSKHMNGRICRAFFL
jgi:hypothetical protein